jgi:hypothetical protein
MRVKKAGGKVYGADLNAAERKAMDLEIQRQLAEFDLRNEREIDAIILWELHQQFGFGPKRLKHFYQNFGVELHNLIQRYQMSADDEVWLATHILKEYGIDLEEWEREMRT